MRLSIGHRNSWHQKALAWLSWRRTILTIGQQKNLISSFRCHISWCHISWYHISWHHISWRHIWWCHIWWLYISWHHIPPPPNTRNVQYIQTWPRQSFIIRMMKKGFVAITYFNTFTTIELHVQMNKFGNQRRKKNVKLPMSCTVCTSSMLQLVLCTKLTDVSPLPPLSYICKACGIK